MHHVYKVIDIVGSSDTSIEDAIAVAVERASQTLKHLRWFEVIQTRGHIEDGRVKHYQVMLKVGFTLEDGRSSALAGLPASKAYWPGRGRTCPEYSQYF
jgi:dodecin